MNRRKRTKSQTMVD